MKKIILPLFIRQSKLALVAAGCLLVTACETKSTTETTTVTALESENNPTDPPTELQPTGPKPAWGEDLTPAMQTVIEKLVSYNAKPITELTAVQARQNPTPAMAVMDLIKENNIPVPPSGVDTVGKMIPVNGAQIHARIYTPKTGTAPYPVIVYYHGGGWVIAGIDTYNASAQALAAQTGAIVVAVAYRQAPENKFPTAHNDAFAAYKWVLANAASFNGNPAKVALVGESAGGHLAAAVSIMARDPKKQMPLHQVLVYPIAGYDTNTESYQKYADAKPLNKPLMEWFFKQYLTSSADGKKPWIDLVNADLKNMPSTTIINAQIDPLQTEGKQLADKLSAANVAVEQKVFDGVTHEFFGMAAVLPQAKDAQKMAVDQLKSAFNK